jgi:hypothetical protein
MISSNEGVEKLIGSNGNETIRGSLKPSDTYWMNEEKTRIHVGVSGGLKNYSNELVLNPSETSKFLKHFSIRDPSELKLERVVYADLCYSSGSLVGVIIR